MSSGDASDWDEQSSDLIALSKLSGDNDTTSQHSRSITKNAGSYRHRLMITIPSAAMDPSNPQDGKSAGCWRSLRARILPQWAETLATANIDDMVRDGQVDPLPRTRMGNLRHPTRPV